MLQSSEKFSLSLRHSSIDQHWMRGEWDCGTVIFDLGTIVGSKNKNEISIYEISRMCILILVILLILNLLILKLKKVLG